MTENLNAKLIIFDFDGTLADTTANILATYQMTIEQLGADSRTNEQCRATIGLPLKEGFRTLYPDYTEEQLENCVATYRHIFTANKKRFTPKLYPGVFETLERLASLGVEMSVASSRSHESLIEFCTDCKIDRFFSLILGADDVKHPKPEPEPVLITMNRLQHEADDTIVVGDMPVDILMGNRAGCRTIGVTYGNSSRAALEDVDAWKVIDRLPDLLP